MSTPLEPGVVVDSLAVALPLAPLPADEVVAGAPLAGYVVLGDPADGDAVEIGIWEMTEGVATDVEADEVFVVLAGSATVAFAGEGAPASIDLVPGSVVRLSAGMRTTWTVHERLRKLAIS